MKSIKWAVIAAFVLTFAAFEFTASDTVSGQAGGTSLATPAGVRATDNLYNNKVGIYWNAVRGATVYRIFRNTTNDPHTALDVGNTPADSFFDASAQANQTYFYWIRAENGTVLSDFSAPDQGVRTGTAQQGPVPPLGPPPVPPGNLMTAAKGYLGKALFWDEQMSSTRTVSCGTCHHSGSGGIDPRSIALGGASLNPGPDGLIGTADDVRGSAGVPVNNLDGTYSLAPVYGFNAQVTGRRSVSYVNAGYAPVLFWDGRALGTFRDPITNNVILNAGGALESQVLGPPLSTAEMAHAGRDWNDVAARMAASKPLALAATVPASLSTWINGRTYPELFQEAFGTPDVTPARIALAIGSFERGLYSDQTPLDLANAGIAPLTPQENRGRNVFNASSCNVCHAGNLLTDNTFRYIGVRPQNEDTGRFQVTGNPQNLGEFRTPSLRNVELRGSFFHNGQFTTLEQVVAFYNRGGDFGGNNKPTNLIRPLGLSGAQQADLVAFLKRPLTDLRVANETAPFDRPVLYAESTRIPIVSGIGRAGEGGIVPVIQAISPPVSGNPNFTVSVSGALGNTQAVLIIDARDPGLPTTMPASGYIARVSVTTQNTGAGNGWASVSVRLPDKRFLIDRTFYARWCVYDPSAENGFSVSKAVELKIFGNGAIAGGAVFDAVEARPLPPVQNMDGEISNGTPNVDFDGDGVSDVAAFRDGTLYVNRSRDGLSVVQFGMAGDIAMPGDYDGDSVTDIAVYRPSEGMWYIMNRSGGVSAIKGSLESKPMVRVNEEL